MINVLVTGASGLLGRAVMDAFRSDSQFHVKGTAWSRVHDDLIKINLLDFNAVESMLTELKPKVIVHCAAERRPDVAQNHPQQTEMMNMELPGKLTELCARLDAFLIYISTDYVFDGVCPPYEVDSTPNPLNFYGKTKLAGENAVLSSGAKACILRIPILYGKVEYNSESAVNILVDAVKNTSKTTTMDHYATRYPTNVEDVARVIHDISVLASCENKSIPPILHFSAQQSLTKYEMSVILAKLLRVGAGHLIPNSSPPHGAVDRPHNSQLSVDALVKLGVNVECVDFECWWRAYLGET